MVLVRSKCLFYYLHKCCLNKYEDIKQKYTYELVITLCLLRCFLLVYHTFLLIFPYYLSQSSKNILHNQKQNLLENFIYQTGHVQQRTHFEYKQSIFIVFLTFIYSDCSDLLMFFSLWLLGT